MHSTPISFHLSRITYVFLGIVAGVFIGTTIKFALGWNAPQAGTIPPADNVDAPITTTINPLNVQSRGADLNIVGNLKVSNVPDFPDSRITAPKFCINNDGSEANCITEWVGGSGVQVIDGETPPSANNYIAVCYDSELLTGGSFGPLPVWWYQNSRWVGRAIYTVPDSAVLYDCKKIVILYE